MSDPASGGNRLPLVIGSTVVLVAVIVAIAIGVNGATNAEPTPAAQASSSATASAAASASATPVLLPTTPCTTAGFGTALTPLNEPATVHHYAAAPPATIDVTKLYEMTIATSKGDVVICLQPALAPITVNVIVTLARNHYYDGIPFHRVCPNAADSSCGGSLAIAQGGDPNCVASVTGSTCGQGGPGFSFKDEPVQGQYVAGAVAMANSGANTNGSQFFICTGDDTSLPSSYNLFGHVETGGAVLATIARGDIMMTVTVAQQQ